MTVSSTPCCKKYRPDALRAQALALLVAALCWCCLALPLPARAQTQPDATAMQLQRSEDGVYLSAALRFELPPLVENALYKGISMYFVAEAEVSRERWYWYDRPLIQAVRHLRLSYQPLTRRWRLNVSTVPFDKTGLGVALGQNFDELADALDSMQRMARWKIAEDPGVVEPGARYRVQLNFGLDLSQLPRPMQIGALGRSGWDLSVARDQRLVVESVP